MKELKIQFGTDGWRALLEKEINFETVAIVAQAFADYLNALFDTPKVAIGFDGRKYSSEFAKLFGQVLSGNSIESYISSTICPTPFVSYYVKSENLSAGVMITASHNPAEYNGIKFKANYGGPFFTEETHEVEKLLGKSVVIKNEHNIYVTDFSTPYLKQLYRIIDFSTIASVNLNVLVDSMAGAGETIIQEILSQFDIDCTTIHYEAAHDFDGRIAEPIEKNLEPLSDILKNDPSYSLGLATDGDADRLGVMLEDGTWLSAQETIMLLADYLINVKGARGKLVKTSSVTNKLRKHFETEERKVDDVQVGYKYICESMLADETAFGCEESGGYGYGFHMPERDGILSALLMIEMLANSGLNTLSQLIQQKRNDYGEIFYDRIDWQYEAADRLEKLPSLYDANIKSILEYNVTRVEVFSSSRGIVNGLKFTLDEGDKWLLMRSSETEPIIRIYSEADCNENVKRLLQAGKDLITNN